MNGKIDGGAGQHLLRHTVFIHLTESEEDSPLRLAIASLFAAKHDNERPLLKTSLLTISELMVHPYRRKDAQLEAHCRVFSTTTKVLEVGPVDLDVLLNAAELRANYSGLKLPDAIHMATAFAFGCTVFLSADERISGENTLDFRHGHPFFTGLTKGTGSIKAERLTRDSVINLVEQITA
jgi:predicted nucleic acid-binding protein